MFCPKCGSKIIEGNAFCTNCGSKANVGDNENSESRSDMLLSVAEKVDSTFKEVVIPNVKVASEKIVDESKNIHEKLKTEVAPKVKEEYDIFMEGIKQKQVDRQIQKEEFLANNAFDYQEEGFLTGENVIGYENVAGGFWRFSLNTLKVIFWSYPAVLMVLLFTPIVLISDRFLTDIPTLYLILNRGFMTSLIFVYLMYGIDWLIHRSSLKAARNKVGYAINYLLGSKILEEKVFYIGFIKTRIVDFVLFLYLFIILFVRNMVMYQLLNLVYIIVRFIMIRKVVTHTVEPLRLEPYKKALFGKTYRNKLYINYLIITVVSFLAILIIVLIVGSIISEMFRPIRQYLY